MKKNVPKLKSDKEAVKKKAKRQMISYQKYIRKAVEQSLAIQ